MGQQKTAQRIDAYAWCFILAVAGGALKIGALGGSPGEEPATVFAHDDTPPPIIAADPDDELYTTGGAGITPVSNTERSLNGPQRDPA